MILGGFGEKWIFMHQWFTIIDHKIMYYGTSQQPQRINSIKLIPQDNIYIIRKGLVILTPIVDISLTRLTLLMYPIQYQISIRILFFLDDLMYLLYECMDISHLYSYCFVCGNIFPKEMLYLIKPWPIKNICNIIRPMV